MNYPLENLGPHRFQQLCQALLSKSFPDAQCFPISQPDGGRDATLTSKTQHGKEFIIFQVKFTSHALRERQPHKSIVQALRHELPKLKGQIQNEATKFILMTNVPGTAPPKRGSIDALQELLDNHISVPAQCWWRDEIERRLDDAWDIKWSFPEVLRNYDILRLIIERNVTEDAVRRTSTLRTFFLQQYDFDADVRFKQIDLRNNLLDLFMDVPVTLRKYDGNMGTLHREHRALLEIAHQYGSSSPQDRTRLGAATMLLDPIAQAHLPRVVIEGAPGQGKSTIVQYVCQVHRERLLNEGGTDPRIPEKHINSPVRLPFKIDCRDFAVWLSGKNPFASGELNPIQHAVYRTLESFLAAQIESSSGGAKFDVIDFRAVVRMAAVLIVFDGLDEVADISERRRVVDEISKGVRRIQDLSISLQTIVTSRPTTFANSPGLPRQHFLYLQLGSIDRATIGTYAEKWVTARGLREREARDVQRTLNSKLDQPHLRDLARNPMQLTILLSLIHRKGTSLPDKRTALYDSYTSLFFDREAEKSDVVRDQRDLLIDIHRYLAWILHSEAQTKQTGGRIEGGRLRDVVREYLIARRHNLDLLDALFSGVVERVVALVSRIEGIYEFEVQPMREYFTARYLYDTAPYSPVGDVKPGTLPERFEALASDFFWQNVTRFYAGCYSQGELPSLVMSLRALSRKDGYTDSCYPQSLAVTLLSDYTFSQYPLIVQEIVDFVLNEGDFRLIVASELHARRGHPLYLPKGSGNRELLGRCFEELLQQPETDYAYALLDIIETNSTQEERTDRWWEALDSIEEGTARTQWISYGLRLGAVQSLSSSSMEVLLAVDGAEYRERVFNFAFGGMWKYVSQDVRHINTVVDIVLDCDYKPLIIRDNSFIQTFASVLSGYRYAVVFRDRSPASLSRILERQWPLFGNEQGGELHPEADYEILRKCHDLIHKSKELSEKVATKTWATNLAPWENLTEYGRRQFGDRWIFCELASLAAGIRSRQERCSDAANLFDVDVPIARRARHARLRAGHLRWWREHLTMVSNQMDIAFLLLLLFRWAGPTVIVRMKEEIEERLSELDVRWWGKLFRALADQVRVAGQRRAIGIDGMKLGDKVSERFVIGLCQRVGKKASDNLFLKYLRDYSGEDSVVLEYCQEAAVGVMVSDQARKWRDRLPGISVRFQKGVRPILAWRPWRYLARRAPLPLDLAEGIVRARDKFPVALVGWAERMCRAAGIAEKVVPVGRVAKKKKWFD